LAPGAAEALAGPLDSGRVFGWRDQVVDGLDDSSHERWLADRDVELVRAEARVAGPGRLEVAGRGALGFDALVVATGSSPSLPDLPGLGGAQAWTTAEATSASEVPDRLAVVGGGVAGCELAQLYRRLGAEVTMLVRGERLL